ncbi:hypothetical protein Tco_1338123, partial [Tanacetum coccineum]
TTGLDKLRLSRAQILWGMYYKKNVDYAELLWEDFTYQIDNRGATPPKKARKSMKPASPKLTTVLVSLEEPTRKETPVKLLSKKKEKMIVEKCKGIDLLSKVALTKEDYAAKIKPLVTNEGTGAKPGVLDTQGVKAVIKKETVVMTIPNLTKKKDVGDDEEEKDDEFVKTPSNSTDDEDITNAEDKDKGDEDKGMDYTTNQFDDDVNVRLNEPVNTYEGLIQKKGVDAKMINVQQGIENLETTLNQVIEDAHVTLSTVTKKTKILITSSSYSSDLASKFLNFLDIPHTDVEIISPMDVHVHHENDPFNTQVTALVDEHLDSRLRATRDEFMSYLSASITVRITEQVKSQLPQILPKEVSNFAPVVIKSMVTVSLEHAVLAKESSQPKSTYEAAASLIEFELKKILIDKRDESQSYLTASEHRECYDRLIKSYDLDKSLFSTYDKVYSLKRSQKDKYKDEDPSAGSDRGLKNRKTSKDAELRKGLKTKESTSGSSKGAKSQSKSCGKSVQSEEPKFEVAYSDMR